MTQDEIIQMARQLEICELTSKPKQDIHYSLTIHEMESFANLVARHEREACAQILANTDLSGLRDHPLQNWVAGLLFEFIKAIRARNK